MGAAVHAGAADHVGRPSPASHRLDPLQPHGHTSDQASSLSLHSSMMEEVVTFTGDIYNMIEV